MDKVDKEKEVEVEEKVAGRADKGGTGAYRVRGGDRDEEQSEGKKGRDGWGEEGRGGGQSREQREGDGRAEGGSGAEDGSHTGSDITSLPVAHMTYWLTRYEGGRGGKRAGE